MHRPAKEPTSGAGPLSAARLWEEIRQAADRGAGVLVTTHNMEEAQQCNRLVVMAAGAVVAQGTVSQVTGSRTVTEVRCDDASQAFTILDAGGIPVQLHGRTLRASAPVGTVASLLDDAGIYASVLAVPADLDEVFAALA